MTLLLVAACVLTLWYPVRLDVCVDARLPGGATGTLRVRFFSGLLRFRYQFAFHLLEEPSLSLWRCKKGKAKDQLWYFGQEKKKDNVKLPIKEIWENLRLRKLHVTIETGIQDDACLTVLLGGMLASALTSAALFLCRNKDKSGIRVRCAPRFDKDCAWIKLEGIAVCFPIHIIIAIVLWYVKSRKGKKAQCHILSKTS